MGSAMRIALPSPKAKGSQLHATVTYKTTENCTALQWLDKEYGIFASDIRMRF